MADGALDTSSLWRLVETRAAATPEALFAVDEAGRTLTFAEYHERALGVAAALHAEGLSPGDVVSWQLPTNLEALVLSAALARVGAVQNPILPIYRQREVGFVVRQAGAKRLAVPETFRGFAHGAMARAITEDLPEMRPWIVGETLPTGDPSRLPPYEAPSPRDTRFLFYTSGTTADPKGARHSDATLLAVGRALHERLALERDDRIALVFPFTHVGGVGWLLAGLLSGCAQIVITTFGPEAIAVLSRHGVTQGTAGTAFHQSYLAAQRERGAEPIFPRIRTFPGGGAPKPPALHYEIKRELGGAGIVSGYGLTECPIATMGAADDPDERLAETEGRATRGVEVRTSPEGEIRLKGPQLCLGYLDPALDAAAFDEAGFFKTGDLGHLTEDGYLVVTGRLKDVIIRKGENISAKEIEDLLHEHPKVAECAVVGLPDPASGERACAVVVATDPKAPLTFEEMASFLRERELMTQRIPEQLETLDALPRNPTGKVLKHALRERFERA